MKSFVESIGRDEFSGLESGLFDTLPGHAAILDTDGTIIAVNAAWKDFARANGYQGDDFGLGTNYVDMCGGDQKNPTRYAREAVRVIRGVLSGEIQMGSFDYPCHAPDEHRWFRMVVSGNVTDGQPGALMMHFNVTTEMLERQKAQRTLRKLHANSSVHKVLAQIIHDVKSPLNAVQGMADFIHSGLAGPTTEKQEEYLGHILEAAEQARVLIDSEIQRIFSDDDEASGADTTDPAAILSEIHRTMAAQAAAAEISLEAIVPDALPVLALPANVLRRVVSNLVTNAIRYAGAGASVTVSAMAFNSELVINVDDDGVGVPEDELAGLMQPMRRGSGAESSGTGLGLAAVRDLANDHGATFSIHSAEGQGFRATIVFSDETVVPFPGSETRQTVAA